MLALAHQGGKAWDLGSPSSDTSKRCLPSSHPSPRSISPVDRNPRDSTRMARQAWESWGSWSHDVGHTLDQAAGSSLGRQGSSGARTALGVTNRCPGLCSHALTQRRDSFEGPGRAAVWIRKEGRRNDKLIASPSSNCPHHTTQFLRETGWSIPQKTAVALRCARTAPRSSPCFVAPPWFEPRGRGPPILPLT